MKNNSLTRREMVALLAAAGAAAALPGGLRAQSNRDRGAIDPWRNQVAAFLATLARPDHGYAWPDQEISHLAPTYAVIGSHRLLGLALPNPEALIKFVQTHHPQDLKKLEQERRIFDYQQIQSLAWLGADLSGF